jgi:hypothetical protein
MDINTLFFVESSLFFLFGLTMLVNSLANPGLRGAYWFVISNLAGGVALFRYWWASSSRICFS